MPREINQSSHKRFCRLAQSVLAWRRRFASIAHGVGVTTGNVGSWVVMAMVVGGAGLCSAIGDAAEPVKVFILVGQSNMQGQASISTIDSLADKPALAPLLNEMRDEAGKYRVCRLVN